MRLAPAVMGYVSSDSDDEEEGSVGFGSPRSPVVVESPNPTCVMKREYDANVRGQLERLHFTKGEQVNILRADDPQWWLGEIPSLPFCHNSMHSCKLAVHAHAFVSSY